MAKGVAVTIIIVAAVLVAILAIASYQPPGQNGNSTLGSFLPCILRADGGSCWPWIKPTSVTSSQSLTCCPQFGARPLGIHSTEGGSNVVCPANVPPCPPPFQSTSTTSQTCVCPPGMRQAGNACVADCPQGQLCEMNARPCISQQTPSITCSNCNSGTCSCSFSCTSGTLDYFSESTCKTLPTKEKVFFNGSLPVSVSGTTYLKIFCDDSSASVCTTVNPSINTCSCPSGYTQQGNVCTPNCYLNNPRCMIPSFVLNCQSSTTTSSILPCCNDCVPGEGRVCPAYQVFPCQHCTTSTTTSSTCSCPSGYSQYGNVCTPGCYFSRPPCLAAPVSCQ